MRLSLFKWMFLPALLSPQDPLLRMRIVPNLYCYCRNVVRCCYQYNRCCSTQLQRSGRFCCCSFRHDDGVRLEEQLQLRHLEQLRFWFDNHRSLPPVTGPLSEGTRQRRAPCHQRGRLSRDDFKQVVAMVIGSHDYDDQLDSLFTKVQCQEASV